ncbi:MAG TPA: histidine kinase dimerization/phospho-acceptor domain-containing protein, partial [Thermodesulfovibrionales bacterium]|nr:histidine kinase dimerization/phospho-acceptor domain-containing protein [Thermodesulfovibrionales bacterium]
MKNSLRYVYAILAVSLAVLLRYALVPMIGPGLPYVTLFPVTVSVALLAGFGPAILTGFIGALAVDYLFIPPLFTADIDIAHLSRWAIVTLTSAFVGHIGDSLRAARLKAEKQALALSESEQRLTKAHSELEIRVIERTAELARSNKELEEEITQRQESELRIAVTNSVLKLYTTKFVRREYLDAVVELIRKWSGCQYVGIRIADKDGNIPYEACAGFSPEFIASESLLSLKLDQCACTRIVLGAPEPQDMPAMTLAGSFYCNNTMKFVEGLTDEEKARFRGVCIRSGFLSVAVIPIRYRERTVGAIHLADKSEGTVSLDKVEFIEQLAFIIGEALFRFSIEEELQRLNKELEQRVADRTAQLEAANKELEAFSYSVSHDLRAPLRSMDGFSQAILEDYGERLDDRGKDFLRRVRSGSQIMSQLIDDLLDLSRVTRSEMRRVTVDLSDLAWKIADDLKETQPDRKVEFIITEGLRAEGDDKLLYLVLQNLLNNAWKFTEKNQEARIEFGALQMRNADFRLRNEESDIRN